MPSCMTPTLLQAVRQHSVNWSGTPIEAGQGPAAAHLSLSGCGPRPHLFSKICLGDQSKETKIYYGIVYFFYLKCFRLVLKRKGNARLFSNLVWHTDGRGAGGRRGHTCETEIYFMIVMFYYFKCFRIVFKSKGNACLFSNLVWQRKCSQFLKLCLEDVKRKYILGLFIFTILNAFD